MKKTIILYGKRNTGFNALMYLVAKGYNVKVADESDLTVLSLARDLGCPVVSTNLELTIGQFGLFLCVHGTRIIEDEYLKNGLFVNIHPCLDKYKGANPIKRYLKNKDEIGSVSSHFMTSEIDGGEIIHTESFATGKISTFQEFYDAAAPFYWLTIKRTLEKLGI